VTQNKSKSFISSVRKKERKKTKTESSSPGFDPSKPGRFASEKTWLEWTDDEKTAQERAWKEAWMQLNPDEEPFGADMDSGAGSDEQPVEEPSVGSGQDDHSQQSVEEPSVGSGQDDPSVGSGQDDNSQDGSGQESDHKKSNKKSDKSEHPKKEKSKKRKVNSFRMTQRCPAYDQCSSDSESE
jgi:hypothetical protein